jgi:hypothetical protein
MIGRLSYMHRGTIPKLSNPLVDSLTLLKNYSQMEQYVDRVFIEYNKLAYCRLRIAFDIKEDGFFEDDCFLSHRDIGSEKTNYRYTLSAMADG